MPATLPAEARAALESGAGLDFDPTTAACGGVTLKTPDALERVTVGVVTEGTAAHRKDSRRRDDGMYRVPLVDLVASGEHYPAHGLLVWFPVEGRFGQYDDDHNHAWVFSRADWAAISADPARYLGFMWRDGDRTGTALRPYRESHPFEPLSGEAAGAPDPAALDLEALRHQAFQALDLLDLDEAEALLPALAERCPDDADVHRRLGDLHLARRRTTAARPAYERAAELAPLDPLVLLGVADLRRRAKDKPGAREAWDALGALPPAELKQIRAYLDEPPAKKR